MGSPAILPRECPPYTHFSLDGWRDASETRNVTLELVKRGYAAEEIGKIWSGNALRVWSEAEEVAAESKR